MIKKSNKQICIIVPKEIDEKLQEDAKKCFSSRNWVARKILVDHYKDKDSNKKTDT